VPNSNDLLTSADVADILGVPLTTIDAWRRARIGPPAIRLGPLYLYPRAMLTAWLRDGGALEYGISIAVLPRAPGHHLEQPFGVKRPLEGGLASGL
jgi:hypothetical protein